MKAMVLTQFNAPLTLKEVPTPKPGPGEILVKMKACALCNTDNKIRAGKISAVTLPHIQGHEPAGIVAELGEGVTHLKVGDHVTFLHYISCGKCVNCLRGRPNACLGKFQRLGFELAGGWAEYMLAPANNALVVPKDLPFEQAALIPDAICTGIHAIYDMGHVQKGDTVLIAGMGGIGIHGMQVAKALGATCIVTARDPKKAQRARDLGMDYVINPNEVDVPSFCKEATHGLGVDVAIDFIGVPSMTERAFLSLRKGGTLVMVGYEPGKTFSIPSEMVPMGECTIVGAKHRLKHNMPMGLEFILDGRVKPQIDRIFPLEQANEALDCLARGELIGRGVLVID